MKNLYNQIANKIQTNKRNYDNIFIRKTKAGIKNYEKLFKHTK